jgi:hypothetical protein
MFLKSVDTSTENTDLLEIFDHFVRGWTREYSSIYH